jgi:molecular chaperone HscA
MALININLKDGNVAKEEPKEVIIGIDLGTTNSLVAYIKDGKPVCVKDAKGKSTLVPSVLHFTGNGDIVVGEQAKNLLIEDPQNTIYSVKRLMGKSYKDVGALESYFGYKIIDEKTDSLVKIRVKDKFYTPVDLSSYILKELKTRVETELGQTVSKAVITVPAYFNDAQRQATRDAGKLAGLDVLRIVNEPTAASLAYGLDRKDDAPQTIAVYDLGGGTFDISILQIEDGIFEVLATNGDTFLGGDDFDRVIIDEWVSLIDVHPDELGENKQFGQAIRLMAEEAKKQLSTEDNFNGMMGDLELSLTKIRFEELIKPLVQKTIACSEKALKDAHLHPKDIEAIVVVGGSTRIPYIKTAVSTFFGKEVHDDLNPDEVVALGAAIQADILAGNQKDILLIDITPLSLGIETVGGLMDTIVPRNSKVPSKVGRQYTTSVDGQQNLKIAVYQGERDLVEHNRKLGEFILKGIPPMPAGLPKIDIQFILDADGILRVKAKELRSEVETQIEIRSQYGVSEEEMALMLLDSLEHAQEDMAKRSLLEARNEANLIILAADKFLKHNKDILSLEETKQTIRLVKILKKTVDGNEKDAIQAAMDELNIYTEPLAHRAMDVTIGGAMKGKAI